MCKAGFQILHMGSYEDEPAQILALKKFWVWEGRWLTYTIITRLKKKSQLPQERCKELWENGERGATSTEG